MIKRIRIQNFKSLRDVTVSLDPMTVLIGRSGTGKTNFVNAIRLLRDYLAHRGDHFVSTAGGWNRLFSATATEKQVSFSVTFDVRGIPGDFVYELNLRPQQGSTVLAEALSLGGRELFRHKEGKWLTAPGLVSVPQPGQLVIGLVYGIPEARVAHLVLTKGMGCYDFPGAVLAAASDAGKEGLNDSGTNYLSAFDAITSNLSDLDSSKEMLAALRKLNNSISSVELETLHKSHIIIGHKVGDGKILSFPVAEESEGFRRFLAHLIALYQTPPKQALIFEEPEKGIFPGALAVLADYFKSCAERGRSQVILTTHSPQLLSHFAPEQIRVVELDGYDTKIGPVSKDQLDALREHLLTTEELLTVDTARLDPASAGT